MLDDAKAIWPAWVCLLCYVIFLIGFWPWPHYGTLDITQLYALDIVVFTVFSVVLVGFPANVLFGFLGKIARAFCWAFLVVLLVVFGFFALASAIFSTEAGAILMGMRFIGVVAIAVLLGSALHQGCAVFRPWVAIACAVLAGLGGWSVISSVVMLKQAEHLSEGRPYTILLREPGVEFLRDPSWWRLRGAIFSGPNGEGNAHRYFYFHAVLNAGVGEPAYNWSKRYMRFDLIE